MQINIFDRKDGQIIGNNDNGETPKQVLKWLSKKGWRYDVVLGRLEKVDSITGNIIYDQLCNDCGEPTGEKILANDRGIIKIGPL